MPGLRPCGHGRTARRRRPPAPRRRSTYGHGLDCTTHADAPVTPSVQTVPGPRRFSHASASGSAPSPVTTPSWAGRRPCRTTSTTAEQQQRQRDEEPARGSRARGPRRSRHRAAPSRGTPRRRYRARGARTSSAHNGSDQAESAYGVALLDSSAHRRGDALARERVDVQVRDDLSPPSAQMTGNDDMSPSGTPYEPSETTATDVQSPAGVPWTHVWTWSIAAFAADAADDAPRASMIAAPRLATVGMNVSRSHASSSTAWARAGRRSRVEDVGVLGRGVVAPDRQPSRCRRPSTPVRGQLGQRAVVVEARHRGEPVAPGRRARGTSRSARWCWRGCRPRAPARRRRRPR